MVSHTSALAVHGIGEFESARVHLTVPASFSIRDPEVTLHFADLPPGDIVDPSGYRVTTVLPSLIDVAAEGADEDQLGRAIHESIAAGHLTLRQLRARQRRSTSKALCGSHWNNDSLTQSNDSEISLDRLGRRVVFERVVSRLEVAQPGRWVLKGGMAL